LYALAVQFSDLQSLLSDCEWNSHNFNIYKEPVFINPKVETSEIKCQNLDET
jgi:hypothetical protein